MCVNCKSVVLVFSIHLHAVYCIYMYVYIYIYILYNMKQFYLFMLKLLHLMQACEYSNIDTVGLAEVKKISLIGDCESLIWDERESISMGLGLQRSWTPWCFLVLAFEGDFGWYRDISGGCDLVSCCHCECWPIISWAFLWMVMLQQVLDAVGWPPCWKDWSSSWACCCSSTSLYAALTFSAMPSASLEARPQVRDYFGCAQILWTFHCLFCQSNSSLCCKKQV